MKKRYLGLLALATILTSGLAVVNEYNENEVVDAEEVTATLSFADTSKRTSYSKTEQVWEDNGIKLTNNKGDSTNDVGDYSNPARFYKTSKVIIEYTQNFYKLSISTSGFDKKYRSPYLTDLALLGTVTDNTSEIVLELTNPTNKIEFVTATGQVRANSISVFSNNESGDLEPEQPDPTVNYDEDLVPLFSKYYNDNSDEYTKHTKINLKTDDNVKADLAKHFHTSNFPTLERNTYYKDNALWMQNGTNYSFYGTDENGNMTSGRVANIGDTVDTLSVAGTSMEDYYVTLDDFVNGTHNSVHSKNVTLNLKEGWTKNGKVYTSTSEDVFDAFRLFTAPLWIGKTAENANYIPFTKATVEEVNNTLVMSLYVNTNEYSATEGEGKITDASGLFSQATIKKGVLNKITTITDALAGFAGEKVELNNVTVESIYQGGEWSEQHQNMSFYVKKGTDKILVFRTGERVYVGDVVNVSGEISIYKGTAQIAQGATTTVVTPHEHTYSEATCKDPATCSSCGATTGTTTDNHDYVSGVCRICSAVDPDYEGEVVIPEEGEDSLAVKATTGALANDSLSISWSTDNFTLLNEKGSSSSAIRTSDSGHFRVYVGNKMTVSGKDGADITKIVITCVSGYVLNNVKDVTGADVSISGTTVTITNITADFAINTSKQWRISNITVTYTK